MRRFEDERYYLTTDSELELLGSTDAMAKRRSRGQAPRYSKIGKRILYRGRDLNEFLDECVIEPTSRRGRSERGDPASDTTQAQDAAAV